MVTFQKQICCTNCAVRDMACATDRINLALSQSLVLMPLLCLAGGRLRQRSERHPLQAAEHCCVDRWCGPLAGAAAPAG